MVPTSRVPCLASWPPAKERRKLSLLVLLTGLLRGDGQHVKWLLSTVDTDASCNAVCSASGFKCTEDCWPAAVPGLQVAVQAPQLSGVCFQVSQGSAQRWHPAKDAENSLCYWNPGASQEPRCPVVSKTPAKAAAEGRWTRRICPCLNQTTVVISDCGLRNEPAARHISDALSEWSKANSQSTTLSPAPQSAVVGVPAKPLAAGTKFVAVPQTCSLCVTGFAGEDTTLNGRYSRVADISGPTESWQQGSLMLEKGANGHWQFRERQLSGKYVPISQGSLSSAIPQSDFYSTSTGGWDVQFRSCCGYPDRVSSVNNADGDSGGMSPGVIVAIVLIILVFVIALSCYTLRRQVRLCFHNFRGKRVDPTTSFKAPEDSDAELGQAKAVDSPRARKLTAQDLRAAAVASGSLPPVPPVPPALADAKNYAHGVYEGPMQPWWGEGSDAGMQVPVKWQFGDKVRLCGLAGGSTWNGAVGVVDGSRMDGLLQIRLSDGRLKAARPENLESPNAPQRVTGGAANRSGSKFHDPNLQETRFPSPDSMYETNISDGTPHSDAGAGVTSWLASTASSQQDSRNGAPQGNMSKSGSWAKLPQKSGSGSAPPGAVATPTRAQGQQPPVPARGGRASSYDAGPAQQVQQPSPARRSASSGPGNRAPPANDDMSLAPHQRPGGLPMRDTPAMSVPRRQEPAFGLQDDLALAQKRTQAKLKALKTQLGSDYPS